jgi:hypothetical protein
MGTGLLMILLGFALAAAIVILVIVRLDRSVRRRYAEADVAAPQESESQPARQDT